MRVPHSLVALGVLATFAALPAIGCSNQNDQTLFGGEQSPTQIQRESQGPGPVDFMPDPDDGTSQDPFTDNPNYPYQPDPMAEPGSPDTGDSGDPGDSLHSMGSLTQ